MIGATERTKDVIAATKDVTAHTMDVPERMMGVNEARPTSVARHFSRFRRFEVLLRLRAGKSIRYSGNG